MPAREPKRCPHCGGVLPDPARERRRAEQQRQRQLSAERCEAFGLPPTNLGKRLHHALARSGFTSATQANALPDDDILAIRQVGVEGLALLRASASPDA